MSFGLSIKNNSNEFLISTDMRNLHHLVTVTNPSISVITNNYGGLTRFSYTFTLDSSYIPVPFFTTPFADRYYAIEKISNSGNNWTVQLISSGGYPTTTDNGSNPSGGQLTLSTNGPIYSKANTGINPISSDKYFVIETPSSTSSTFTGTGKYTVVWGGTKVIDNVNITITNGVPQTFDGGGTASSDDNLYFPRESTSDVLPLSITDNPSATETNSGSNFYFFRVLQQYYTTTSGSSGNQPSGSYGSAQIPKLIVFADARAVTGTETFGLKVFRDDGTAAFDNRKNPLIISEITSVSHPTNATSSFSGGGLSARNASGPVSTWSNQAAPNQHTDVTVNTMPTNQMFYYSTVTQVHQQVSRLEAEEECDGVNAKGNCVGSKRIYYWRSTYWNFYRGGIKRYNNTSVYAGYIGVEFGSYHSRTLDSAFFGVSTGGSSGSAVGKWPWNSGRINAAGTGVNTLIIADATNYI
jgi:hypothetical protein